MTKRRRAGLAAALGAGMALGVLAPAPAHAANDWTNWTDFMTDIPGYLGDYRTEILDYKGGQVVGRIGWTGTSEVWLDASASDTQPDGYGIALQIRYQVYRSGAWSGWQHRTAAQAGGNGTWDGNIYENNAPIRYVQVRGCYYDNTGIVNCDNSWH